MPRKKTTRAAASRAKPKLKDVNSEDALTAQEREAKKQAYLMDCDLTVKKLEEELDEDLKLMLSQIDKTFAVLRLKLAPNTKQMVLEDYILSLMQQEEDEERDTFDTDRQTILCNAQPTPSQLNSQPTPSHKSLVLSKYRSKRTVEPILEEGAKPSTVKRKTRGTKKNQGVSFNAEQAGVPTAQSSFITPAMSRNATALGWNTPLITPKFDPRLPITPAQRRNARPGEIAISLAGSPLNVDSENKNTLKVNKKGKTLQIQVPTEFENILDNFDIPDHVDLENNSQDNVQKMMSMFAMIMKKGESESE